MTIYTVTTIAESGAGSLRQADARARWPMIEPAREAVFIDPCVPDIDHLTRGARSGTRLFVLNRLHEGLRQIVDTLTANRFEDLAAIHIVSHGAPGELRLGRGALTHSDLGERADVLAAIGAALAPD